MSNRGGDHLRVALTSKGAYEESTSRFLDSAGLSVWRPNPRQYVGRVSQIPAAEVLFQRPEDIVHKVADGSADIGITGYDLVAEHAADDPNVHLVLRDLGFRRCQLVLAVPDSWLDITTIDDLAELSIEFKRSGRQLRVATKFPTLVADHLYRGGVNYFSLTAAHGALEAAPALGYADVIADLTETGVTLRDNHLRVIEGGVVLRAQACLIANVRAVLASSERLEQARTFIELCEARIRSRGYRAITANVAGDSHETVAARIVSNIELAGEAGPTVSQVFPKYAGSARWFSVSVIVPSDRMLAAVDHLRAAGSSGITVSTPDYMFDSTSSAFAELCAAGEGNAGRGSRRTW
ncbi:MAG TPA: ATP phosphoribosyltransferase [Thermomicrobiales bacterium]|nr:ATP phosphoribosyltransferase [Thermomicrobiales bacterium]